MRIFYYAQVDLSGESGSIGSVRHVLEIVNRLSRRGHEVTLFVPQPQGEVNDEIKADKVVYFTSGNGITGFIWSILACLTLMLRESIKHSPECIYSREMLYTFHTPLIARILSCDHVTEVNGFQPEELTTDPNFNSFFYPILLLAEAMNYWLSDQLIMVSSTTEKKAREFYKLPSNKTNIFRNGVNTDRCKPMNKKDCRKELNLDPDRLHAGFLGYLFPWSGVDYIIKAAPAVIEEFPESRFVIIGSGTWGDHLPSLAEEKGVRENFIFTGKVPWKEVPLYLNCLDIGLSPYTNDRDTISSLKTYEYLACGLPVVVSNLDDVMHLLEGYECGVAVEPEHPDQLSDAIIQLFSNPDLRENWEENARKLAVEQYDWDRTVDKTEKLLERI